MVPFLYAYYYIEGDAQKHKDYLRETARVLREGKLLILTYLWKLLVLVKDSQIDKDIPLQVRLYRDHPSMEIFLKVLGKVLKKQKHLGYFSNYQLNWEVDENGRRKIN